MITRFLRNHFRSPKRLIKQSEGSAYSNHGLMYFDPNNELNVLHNTNNKKWRLQINWKSAHLWGFVNASTHTYRCQVSCWTYVIPSLKISHSPLWPPSSCMQSTRMLLLVIWTVCLLHLFFRNIMGNKLKRSLDSGYGLTIGLNNIAKLAMWQ